MKDHLIIEDEVPVGLTAGYGDQLPVSSFPVDGTYPCGTSQLNPPAGGELAPVWDPAMCTQCGACSLACPQGVIRLNLLDPDIDLPAEFPTAPSTTFSAQAQAPTLTLAQALTLDSTSASALAPAEPFFPEKRFALQVNVDQCNSCKVCLDACEAGALEMQEKSSFPESARDNWNFFSELQPFPRTQIDPFILNQQQLQEPLFRYSTGDKGCAEAQYLKLLSQLFGDRMLVANATGSSSIFGGALPTTPWSSNAEGRGPAWSNSLFEDNAEFGLGFRVSLDNFRSRAQQLLVSFKEQLPSGLYNGLLQAPQQSDTEIEEQRQRVAALKRLLEPHTSYKALQLKELADYLVEKLVWIVGGDGWAYDCGFSGLDHVLSTGQNVNLLVLDNELYSNTGGQVSKSTPFGATGKFAARGKRRRKKDLATLAMAYDDVYVASVAIGADPTQTLRALIEAARHDGPSIVLAYCHSPAHGIDMERPWKQHKAVVASGQWPLFRRNPSDLDQAFHLDAAAPSIALKDYLSGENRFDQLMKEADSSPMIMEQLEREITQRFNRMRQMAELPNDN